MNYTRYLTATVMSIAFPCLSLSQCTSGWQWAQNDNGVERNELHGLALDDDGNTYIAGWFDSDHLTLGGITIDNFSQEVNGSGDMYVAKLDPNGNALWAHAVGGNNSDWCWAMAIDNDGNVAIGGEFYSSTITIGTTTVTNSGLSDVFVAVFNSDGDLLWMKDAGTTGSDSATGITFDNDGNLFLTGQFDGTATFGIWPLVATGSDDIFLAKYNTSGGVLWAHNYGGTGSENGLDMVTNAAGDVFLNARTFSTSFTFASDSYTNAGMADVLLLKISSDGTEQWMKSFGGTMNDEPTGIALDSEDHLVICGHFWSPSISFGNTTLTPAGQDDMFLLKTDANGVPLWAIKAGGTETDRSQDCAVDVDDNIYMCGHVGNAAANFNGLNYPTHGFFLAQFDGDGATQWVIGDGGPNAAFASWDEAFEVDVNASAAISIGGDFMSTELEFGDIVLPHTADFGMVQGFYAHYSIPSLPSVTDSGDAMYCEGDNGLISVDAVSALPVTYQWYLNEELLDGETAAQVSWTNIQPVDAGSYTCVVTNDCGPVHSNDIQVDVFEFPEIIFPGWSVLCENAPAEELVVADGADWSGAGVSNNVFDPSMAGVGDHALMYFFDNQAGCTEQATYDVHVSSSANAGEDNAVTVCIPLGEYLLSDALVNAGETGTWWDENFSSTNPLLDLEEMGPGEFDFYYVVVGEEPCPSDTAMIHLTVDTCIGMEEIASGDLAVYLHASHVEIRAKFPMQYIALLDGNGKTCRSVHCNDSLQETLSLKDLAPGIYTMTVSQGGKMQVRRMAVGMH